jgi:hypothetical protein
MAHLRTSIAAAALLASSPAWGAEVSTGDPVVGRALFIGAKRLAAGGPPCGACHAVGGAGAPFAATLGPELSRSFEGLPPEAVDGMLQDLPFPTMAPLYAGRALTAAERADLASFLAQVTGSPPPSGARIAGYAALVAVACLVAMRASGRRRKGSTRAELLAAALHPVAHRRRSRATPIAHAGWNDARDGERGRALHGGGNDVTESHEPATAVRTP